MREGKGTYTQFLTVTQEGRHGYYFSLPLGLYRLASTCHYKFLLCIPPSTHPIHFLFLEELQISTDSMSLRGHGASMDGEKTARRPHDRLLVYPENLPG